MLDVNIFQGEMRKHLQNECFICDLERNVFEKVEGVRHICALLTDSIPRLILFSDIQVEGFRKHVKRDHNRWDYMYIWLYLSQMNSNDHNAHEKYIWEQVSGCQCASITSIPQ